MIKLELTFSNPELVRTHWGERIKDYAVPNQAFWMAWRKASDSLKAIGIQVTKDARNEWLVIRLRTPKGEPAPEVSGYKIRETSNLYPWQVPHVGGLVASLIKHGHALDGSDTGAGKTFCALAAAREMELFPAIVCTKRNIPKWERVCKLFSLRPIFIANWEACKSSKFPFRLKSSFFAWNLDKNRTLLILDEAHKGRGENTIASEMVIDSKNFRTLYLSGSFGVTPKDFKALGYVLGFHKLHNFNEWMAENSCFKMPLENGKEIWNVVNAVQAMTEIYGQIYPAHGSRIRVSDVPDFPETHISADTYPIESAASQNAAYDKLITEIMKAEKPNRMVLNLRYRQLAELMKVDLLCDLASEYLDNGLSVVIFVNFTDTLLALADKLKTKCIIAGQDVQTSKQSDLSLRKFQANKERLILVNISAGSDSIDLHDEHGGNPRVSLICPTYNPITLKQALGRVWRTGGKSKSLQRLIYAQGTVEERVCKSVAVKLNSIDALNDGDLAEPDVFKILGEL